MKRRIFLKGIGAAVSTVSMPGCSIMISGYKSKGIISRKILGKTGIEVSRLGLGSHLNKELLADPQLRDRMVKMCFEAGINLFDVYDHSGLKQYEPMGKSVKEFRKEVVISLALTRETAELVQFAIDDALKKFFTDYIDLVRIYTLNDGVDRMSILEKKKKEGKIRAIGLVSHEASTMMSYLDTYPNIDYVMIPYNFHHNHGDFANKNYQPNDYSALIPRCKQMGIGILGMKPMGSDDMISFAQKNGYFNDGKANVTQAMLRYVFRKGEVDSALPAMNSISEMQTNIEAALKPAFSLEEQKLLPKLSDL